MAKGQILNHSAAQYQHQPDLLRKKGGRKQIFFIGA
jgi:hypothetical protein